MLDKLLDKARQTRQKMPKIAKKASKIFFSICYNIKNRKKSLFEKIGKILVILIIKIIVFR